MKNDLIDERNRKRGKSIKNLKALELLAKKRNSKIKVTGKGGARKIEEAPPSLSGCSVFAKILSVINYYLYILGIPLIGESIHILSEFYDSK